MFPQTFYLTGDEPVQIADILEKTGQMETMVLREHAILTILTKLSRYESECALFEKKYGVSLEFFRNQLEQKLNLNLRMEADFLCDRSF